MAKLNIPDSILEDFCCSVCKYYLSCAPVRITPTGQSICNLCSLTTEEPTHRQLVLETFLSKLSFPCQFKNCGCEKRVPFGQIKDHEDNCPFRVYICPVLPSRTCMWEGTASKISDHFSEAHCNLVKETIDFKLWVNENARGVLIVTIDGVAFIIKYMYDADKPSLQCDVRYLACNVQEGSYKIQLTSDSDNDYSITLRGGNYLNFNSRFYGMQDSKPLNLINYMEVLDNPDWIIFTIIVTPIKFHDENASAERLTLDYDFLQQKRCQKPCNGYLIPPLFKGKLGPACYRCHIKHNYNEPLDDNELIECAARANFPCRWRGCEFIGKGWEFFQHDSSCQFRVYNCMDCKNIVTWQNLKAHLESHGQEYFEDTYVYKMKFRRLYAEKKIFTFKNNDVICVGHQIRRLADSEVTRFVHDITPYCPSSSPPKVTAVFVHAHCDLKSKIFTIDPAGSNFEIKDLPACFKNREQLTVTLKI